VALADEIAQQTTTSRTASTPRRFRSRRSRGWRPRRPLSNGPARRTRGNGGAGGSALLQRGLIHLFVTTPSRTPRGRSTRLPPSTRCRSRHVGRDRRRDPAAAVAFSKRVAPLFADLKAFIYRFIINHQEVNGRTPAHLVMTGLFRATTPTRSPCPLCLLRFHEETGRAYLRDSRSRPSPRRSPSTTIGAALRAPDVDIRWDERQLCAVGVRGAIPPRV